MTIMTVSGKNAYMKYAGERVRVVWNPRVKKWYVYNLTKDQPLFATNRLELHTVSVYGELRPEYAPHGSPSFVGTIASNELVEKISKHTMLAASVPSSKVVKEDGRDFCECPRLLLKGAKMIADCTPKTKR